MPSKKLETYREDGVIKQREVELSSEEETQFDADREAIAPKPSLMTRLQTKVGDLSDADIAAYAPLIASVEPLIKMNKLGAVKAMIQGALLVNADHELIRAALLDEPEFA